MRRARPGPPKASDRPATITSTRAGQRATAAASSNPLRRPKDQPQEPVVPPPATTTNNLPKCNKEQDAQDNATYTTHSSNTDPSQPRNARVSSERFVSNILPSSQTIALVEHPGSSSNAGPPATAPPAYIEQIDESAYGNYSSDVFPPNSSSTPPHDLVQYGPSTSTVPIHQSSQSPPPFSSGRASLYGAFLSLADSDNPLAIEVSSQSVVLPSDPIRVPNWPPPNHGSHGDEDDESDSESKKSEDDDPEGVTQAMCATVIPDANVETNALPFVLQSYAQWVNFMVFDPKNVVPVIRDGVIAQFSSSQETRTRVILVSNVFAALGKSPVLNSKVRSVVTQLNTETHQSITRFTSSEPAPMREMDMMNALKAIDLMMEVILLRRFGGSVSTMVGLMEAASPVFRRACPEPLGQLVNLPNILISPSINLRHYAEADIMIATLFGRQMFLQYDISCAPAVNEKLMGPQGGLHWLHGIPDQLIILLARINMLHANFGSNVDPSIVSQIEWEIERVKVTPSTSDNPVYTIRRFAVQECWRLVAYIQLYVTLCGAHAEDPRVVKYVERFMRSIAGIKPTRRVDTFLSLPIMFIGSFASRKQDRNLLLHRLVTMPELTMPGRAGHDSLMILRDIWKRTERENRPALWVDLRISCQTITGV